ncbi:hypothetical protein LOTGIDRAFT_236999 [Lottia gigantea]|uniref:von Hippel-Lindau disease tumour suppressor beta domain-containing protein n=1 Tax=Lottia gigantea TaxID=225164 RepID=V3ZNG3_LOTGI|nr:hypothetical protein LOTGIDRAFT_236999 [Lottia gigantea]ESO82381.1 hypothetical protein LOTGIDRAFT_236999 [Lottia gigantea]
MTGAQNCEQSPPLRSQNNDIPAFITFRNISSRKVDVYWLDYKGQKVKYMENFSTDRNHHINTYVTHPWIARDAVTHDVLLFNGKEVYFPQAWDGRSERTMINIHIPVFKLTNRCIQVLKDSFPEQAIPEFDIPRTLIEDMIHKPNIQFEDSPYLLKESGT